MSGFDVLPSPRFPPWWGRMPEAHELRGTTGPVVFWRQEARGWPVLALWCEWRGSDRAAWGISRSSSAVGESGTLPYRPIPLGLAIDTVFYAAVWFVLLLGFGFVRRQIRRGRN